MTPRDKKTKARAVCAGCGKEKPCTVYTHFFPTIDGWDSIESATCGRCERAGKRAADKAKKERRRKAFEAARKMSDARVSKGGDPLTRAQIFEIVSLFAK